MTGDAAVSVDEDLPAGESAVAGGAADDEPSAGVDEDLRVLVQQFFGDDGFDNVIDNVFLDLIVGGLRGVLGADDHGVDPCGDAVAVLNGHLGLAVRPEVIQSPVFPDRSQLLNQFLGKADREGHQFRGLIAGEPDHHSLVASAGGQHGFFGSITALFQSGGDAFADVSGLFLNGDDHAATLGVDAIFGVGIAGLGQGLADDGGHVHIG